MDLNNVGTAVASRLASLEVVDEFGGVVAQYGPYNNAVTDAYQYAYNSADQEGQFMYCTQMSLYAGKRYPIKYRGPAPATITGSILYAPGLLSDYGVDVSGIGFVNSPSLTGKLIKFDTGEEYYVSGITGGDIILRSGSRIRNAQDVQFGGGGFWDSSVASWFFPSTVDMPSPTNYTVWDVGNYSYASAYGDSPAISTTTFTSHTAAFHPTRTGVQGVYSGKVILSDKFETATFGGNTVLGKISIDLPSNRPFAHVNIGDNSGISILAGQKVRATYETVVDFTPMFDCLTGVISSPMISGMPTSSGFFVPYQKSQPVYANHGHNGMIEFAGGSTMGNNPIIYGAFGKYFGTNAILYPIYTSSIISSMSVPTLSNPSGSLSRIVGGSPNTGGGLAIAGVNIKSGDNRFVGSAFYNTNRYVYTADINNWNGALTGLFFPDVGAFYFYQTQTKAPEYELSIPFNFVSYRRQLIN